MIGSMTKPLTSLMMARLVDRGAFTWDTPVTKLFPAFALGDPAATERATMAHTVCACTGLPRSDMEFIFESKGANPVSRMELLKGMKPTTGFGETFQVQQSDGRERWIRCRDDGDEGERPRSRLRGRDDGRSLKPHRADCDGPGSRRSTKAGACQTAWTDVDFDTQLLATETERGVDTVMPAGGAWSNVRDISRWLLLELGSGKLDGKQIVSEANLLERRKPRVKINARQSYGLALFIDESRGLNAIGHGGNTFGFSADAAFYPDHGLGFVMLTNAASANAYMAAVRRRLIELLFDATRKRSKRSRSVSSRQKKRSRSRWRTSRSRPIQRS